MNGREGAMDEGVYQDLLKAGRALLAMCRSFPAHELMTYQRRNHPADEDARHITSLVWAVHLEAGEQTLTSGERR